MAMTLNEHDLLLIGGGDTFELTRDDTFSGTAIDVSTPYQIGSACRSRSTGSA